MLRPSSHIWRGREFLHFRGPIEVALEVYQRLSEILRDVFDDDSLVAKPQLTADRVEGWDSVAHPRLMSAVQRAFGVNFAASEITSLKNVGELARLIETKSLKQR